jgi:SnoaL-like domain/Protein of unknown function (DUF1214)
MAGAVREALAHIKSHGLSLNMNAGTLPMTLITRYESYATAFEESYLDDDWSRITRYFTDDAVYSGEPEAIGRDAILRKLKAGVDAFDRRSDLRTLEFGALAETGNTVIAPWKATYLKAGLPPLTLEGIEFATFDEDRIMHLHDDLAPGTREAMIEWLQAVRYSSVPAENTRAELSKAWAEYHTTLDEMRQLTEATSRFRDTPQHRATAFHTLMEVQAMAYTFVVAPRRLHPRVLVNSGWQTDIYTLGQNSQDFLYGIAIIDGRQTYRLTGRMGDISLFLLQVTSGVFGEPGFRTVGNYDWADFKIDSDGRFEVILSAEKQAGNWIRLDPAIDFQFIMMRRALVDWHGDKGELRLERISDLPNTWYDADEFDEAAMALRIRRAAQFVRHVVKEFNIALYDLWLRMAGGRKNALGLVPGTTSGELGSPSSNYAMGVLELKDDEALLVDMDKLPDGAYWSFQMGDVWSRPLNYLHYQTSLNNREAVADADGRLRIVISNRDPGVRNWLATCGRVEAILVFRNFRAKSDPVPSMRLLKFAELDALLPQTTARVTPAERKAITERRRLGQLKMYGE